MSMSKTVNTAAKQPRVTRCRLSHDQYFRLCEWCRTNRELVENNTLIRTAEIFNGQIHGFVVQAPQIKQACDTVGIQLKSTDPQVRIKELENRMDAWEQRFAAFQEELRAQQDK